MIRYLMIQTISIIDDNISLSHALVVALAAEGYKNYKFSRPREALNFHKTTPADFYIIDIKLPQMSGIEFYLSLCKQANAQSIPAIFLSASNSQEAMCLASTTIGDFITKPFNFEALLARMQRVIKLQKPS